jgi:glycosyltransferase involved in cell wall biosynthesis
VRLGLLTTSYPRFPGDPAGGFVAEHAAFLAAAGHDVEVIAAGAADGADAAAAAGATSDATAAGSGITIRRVAAAPGLFDRGGAPDRLAQSPAAWLTGARFSLALARAAAGHARRWDAAVAHWLVPSALAALAAPGLPLLAIAHGGDVHLLRRLRAHRAARALFERRGVRLSFVTEELQRLFLDGAPPGHSQVCPMGVDLARLRAARAAHRRIDPSAPTVLFLGRLVPVKGVDVLVRAAELWRSGARLVVAGAGPSRPALERMATTSGRTRFAGQLVGAERDRALATADLVVVPSVRVEGGRSEGFPVVALEAMAAGAALVASSVGGLAELPAGAVTHVPPGDPAALARAIDDLLADSPRRRAQIDAQDRAVGAFDWNEVGPRLVPQIVRPLSRPVPPVRPRSFAR